MARVLIVDDDADQLALRRTVIESAGHAVVEAQSPAEASEKMEALHPEVVVMDLRLPKAEDGVALARKLGGRARVIVLSGAVLPALEGLPVFRALQKPCRVPQLLEAISEAAGTNGNLG